MEDEEGISPYLSDSDVYLYTQFVFIRPGGKVSRRMGYLREERAKLTNNIRKNKLAAGLFVGSLLACYRFLNSFLLFFPKKNSKMNNNNMKNEWAGKKKKQQ